MTTAKKIVDALLDDPEEFIHSHGIIANPTDFSFEIMAGMEADERVVYKRGFSWPHGQARALGMIQGDDRDGWLITMGPENDNGQQHPIAQYDVTNSLAFNCLFPTNQDAAIYLWDFYRRHRQSADNLNARR